MKIHNSHAVHMSKLEAKKAKWGYIFLLPWFLIFCVFFAYPLVYGIVVSFYDYSLRGMSFTGLANYTKIFQDYAFWRSLWATAQYAVYMIPLQVFIPLLVANAIQHHSSKFANLTKVMIYLPGVLCSVALIIVWKFLLSPTNGVVSTILTSLGLPNVSVLDNAAYSIPIMSVLVVLSGLGPNLIIYSSALNGISLDYYDAAEIDGANRWQQFTKITIPLLKPTILYVTVTATIGALQVFVVPKLMTGGGPNYTSSTLLMLIYDSAFTNNQFGYASALGVVLFLITSVIAVVQFRLSQSKADY